MKLKLKELCSKGHYQLQLVLAAGWAGTDHLLLTNNLFIDNRGCAVPMMQPYIICRTDIICLCIYSIHILCSIIIK